MGLITKGMGAILKQIKKGVVDKSITSKGVAKILKKVEKKASKFGEKAIKEASTPGKKLKGWSKIAAPGVPFHVKKIIEGKK
jgi:hypothetical protein